MAPGDVVILNDPYAAAPRDPGASGKGRASV